jgi:hypothetical protein
MVTPYGGIFLLVGAIAELEIPQFLQNCPYPEPEGIDKTGLLLWAIALKCLGYENAMEATRDRGLALFAGLGKPPKEEQLLKYSQSLTTAMHEAFRQQFQAHQQELLSRPRLFMLARNSSARVSSEWFSLCSESECLLTDSAWDATLTAVSAIVLRGFAAKLGAFADSSPPYISRNFLESRAEIQVYSDRIQVRFLTCPLQMVLRMAGFDHNTWEIPWLENRQLTFEFN